LIEQTHQPRFLPPAKSRTSSSVLHLPPCFALSADLLKVRLAGNAAAIGHASDARRPRGSLSVSIKFREGLAGESDAASSRGVENGGKHTEPPPVRFAIARRFILFRPLPEPNYRHRSRLGAAPTTLPSLAKSKVKSGDSVSLHKWF
jgi:hypothetical protein